jgi:protein subunit release factor B
VPRLTFIIIICTAAALMLLRERQHSLRLRHEANQLHARIQNAQSRLWTQQLEMAVYMSPLVVRQMAETSQSTDDETGPAGESGPVESSAVQSN